MKKIDRVIYHKLLAALAWLLLASSGAWAQGLPSLVRPSAVAGPAQSASSVLISNRIQFHGQVPDTQTNYRADPLDVCPNVVDPTTHGIQSQPYQFQFESNCVGNSNSTDCRFRPNFIWTVHYYTETGNEYTEQWQDVTSGDFSKIRLYFYDRVPYTTAPITPTNGQATQASGNTNFSAVPYPNLGCLQAPANTAQEGELITNVWLECTGYSCGFTQGDDTDNIHIRYYNRRVGAISVSGTPADYCRDQPYTLNWGSSFGATGYNVTANNGAQITGISGTSATLNLANVPNTATSVTVSVTAVNSANPCGTTLSATRTLTLPMRRAPAQPTNMQIDGVCPSTSQKTVSINGVTPPTGETSVAYH
ncbi:hypothetical protein [Hymenobacter rubidus]|uniref:hypothetical protein n=1 Tax=Hymenobacter rubidus TaxID=1441626 RepID=UPI0019200EE8|nr:hypothetical protein [Hymenobacter rubidus]